MASQRGWTGVGKYYLVNVATNTALDNLRGEGKIVGYTYNPGSVNQIWTVMDSGDGRYIFYNEARKHFLTCQASTQALIATTDAKTDNSAWFIDAVTFQKTDGKPVIIWSGPLDKNVVDLSGGNAANETDILAYPVGGSSPSNNQRWYMYAA